MMGSKKKIAIFIIILLGGFFSCSREKQKSQESAPGQSSAQIPSEPEGQILSPEAFFKFELERLKRTREFQEIFLKLLKETQTYNPEFEEKKNALLQEYRNQMSELNQKYNINSADLRITYESFEARQAIEQYRDRHPRLKKKIEELSKDLNQLTEEIKTELNRLNSSHPLPSPPAEPQK